MPTARISGMTAGDWLDDVLGLFPDGGLTRDAMTMVDAGNVPEPYRSLLVHRHHMTVTLEDYHEGPVYLDVLATRHQDDDYARQLLLRSDGPQGPVVMAGAMRFLLGSVDEPLRRAIVTARVPLGRLLIENNVLRRIETRAFLKVSLRGSVGELFGDTTDRDFTYGRIAVIYCDGEAAVELLEIVSPGTRTCEEP